MAKIITVAVEWTVWSGIALSVWMLTLASVTGAELAVAPAVAAACGVAATGAHRTLGIRAQPPRRVLGWLPRLPIAIAADTVAVLSLPWRRGFARGKEGDWERVPVAPGPDPLESTTRAAATLLVSTPPGSFVVHDDEDTGELLVHRLVDSPRPLTEVARR